MRLIINNIFRSVKNHPKANFVILLNMILCTMTVFVLLQNYYFLRNHFDKHYGYEVARHYGLEMSRIAQSLFGCGIKLHSTPRAFIDIVADGMYMKNYLKILMVLLGVIAFINVLIQSIRKKMVEIAVMKVQGIRLRKVIVRTT